MRLGISLWFFLDWKLGLLCLLHKKWSWFWLGIAHEATLEEELGSTLCRVWLRLQQYLHCHPQGHVWYCPWSHSETWHGWSPAFCALSEPKQAGRHTRAGEWEDRGEKKETKEGMTSRQIRAAEKSRSDSSLINRKKVALNVCMYRGHFSSKSMNCSE